ncbi:hypothetical protein GMA19_03419 [Paenibacillus polymyxa E681]|nr:hypothetical protein GE561_03421 [Paenibacillus polymyxa E681]QNV63083.1 hypothetical protein GMA19_03419 [Paenibacillus polymyxa E681]
MRMQWALLAGAVMIILSGCGNSNMPNQEHTTNSSQQHDAPDMNHPTSSELPPGLKEAENPASRRVSFQPIRTLLSQVACDNKREPYIGSLYTALFKFGQTYFAKFSLASLMSYKVPSLVSTSFFICLLASPFAGTIALKITPFFCNCSLISSTEKRALPRAVFLS